MLKKFAFTAAALLWTAASAAFAADLPSTKSFPAISGPAAMRRAPLQSGS